MNIFEIKKYQVVFSPQALLLTPFKKIWDNDKDKEKVNAVAEMSYVYYICDDRSDFQYILDENERHEAICRDMDALPNDWERPDYIEDAIEYYKKLSETTSTKLLRSTRGVVQKYDSALGLSPERHWVWALRWEACSGRHKPARRAAGEGSSLAAVKSNTQVREGVGAHQVDVGQQLRAGHVGVEGPL